MTREWTPLYATICTSEKLAQLPDDEARLFYTHMLTQWDSHGRCAARPHVLHARVWPLLGKPVSAVSRCIDACARVGLIEVHELDGLRWLQLPDWEDKGGKHVRRRGEPEFPNGTRETLVKVQDAPGPLQEHPGASAREKERERDKREKIGPPVPGRVPRKKPGQPRDPQPWQHALVDFPSLNIPAFVSAMDEYMAHRVQHPDHKPYTDPGLRQKLRELAAWGVPRSIAAIRHTIGRNWLGIREAVDDGASARNGFARNGSQPTGRGDTVSPEYLDELKRTPRNANPPSLSELLKQRVIP